MIYRSTDNIDNVEAQISIFVSKFLHCRYDIIDIYIADTILNYRYCQYDIIDMMEYFILLKYALDTSGKYKCLFFICDISYLSMR